MTEQNNDWIPTLPGITLPQLGQSGIEASARATLAALDQSGLLEPRHALTCQVVLELARSVGTGLQAGKVTVATATLSKHLLEAIEKLPQPVNVPAGENALAAFQAEVERAANEGHG